MTVRALVVDDSVVVRRTVANVLGEADDIEVIGTAADGTIGLRRIAELSPDVVTLDVEMPGLSGLETLAEIRKDFPALPVIMYSTLTERGAEATLDALALGAVDYATKPSGATNRDEAAEMVRSNLLPLVRLWGRRRATSPRVALRRSGGEISGDGVAAPSPPPPPVQRKTGPIQLVTVGVSTGGPAALAELMPDLPGDLRVPVLIVQHMPPIFTTMLAERLDGLCKLAVSEAVHGERALPGHAYIAPGGQHLEVHARGVDFILKLTDAEPENSCRPAVDVLFRTAAKATGGHVLGVVLTGMGQDGLFGARDIVAAGGEVIAQDEATSVVWGMPGYVAREGLAKPFPLGDLARKISLKAALK